MRCLRNGKYKYYHVFSGKNDKRHGALVEYALSVCNAQNTHNVNSTFVTSNEVASSSTHCSTISWGENSDAELERFITEDSMSCGCKPIVVLHTFANPDIPVSSDFLNRFPSILHVHEFSVRPAELKNNLLKYAESANALFVPQQSEVEDIINTHHKLAQPDVLHGRFAKQLRGKAKLIHHPPLIDASEFIKQAPERGKDMLYFGEVRFFKGLECMPQIAKKMKEDGRDAFVHIAGDTSQERFLPHLLDIASKVFNIPQELFPTIELDELRAFIDIVEGKKVIIKDDIINGTMKGVKLLNTVISNKFGELHLANYSSSLPSLFESLREIPIKFHQNISQQELAELVSSCGCGVALNERGIDNRNSVVPFLLFNSCPAICAKSETPLNELFEEHDADLLSKSVAFVTAGSTARKYNAYPERTAEEVYQQYLSICDHGVSVANEPNEMIAKKVTEMQEAGREFTESLSMDALVRKISATVRCINSMKVG